MSKVTVSINVRGIDLKEMMAQAKEQLADLTDAEWTITDVALYCVDDIAGRDGMARLWNASMTMEATV